MTKALGLGRGSTEALKTDILRHLTFTLGKDADHAAAYDWRLAISFTLRDRLVEPWFRATRRTWAEDRKRVYYLSMEFLIGRILKDAAINIGLWDDLQEVAQGLGLSLDEIAGDEPDAALGNGGLGRLAACYMESMATLGCPAYGYGIRYEHGLFRQRFQGGQQVEAPEDWLTMRNPWEFDRPEAAYTIGFKGEIKNGHWQPAETVSAWAHDMPVIGWQGKWANTLRLWSAKPTTLFDLERFNRGDHTAAAEPEALARTLSRVLYPDDTTYAGKELRLKQEFFLTSAALQDIVRRYSDAHGDLRGIASKVAIQMNDTHPAIAGPELVRLLCDDHGLGFDEAADIAQQTLGYTNHTLLPEALETWSTWLVGNVLPRHMQIIEQIDARHAKTHPSRNPRTAIVRDNNVHMGELAFITSHKVNGVSALHSELVRKTLFPELDALHPGRIVNQTNGVTPRRWLRLANPGLSALITESIGPGWEADLDRLKALEPLADDAKFRAAFRAAKAASKRDVADWIERTIGTQVDPTAIFDVQVKRIHEYKRQLLNLLHTIALWHRIRSNPDVTLAPRVKIFAGKSAPGYAVAKEIIHLINDVAAVVNSDPAMRGRLAVVYPPNYNVSMAERLIPATDLSEQISTAGMEASGTGNMKFALNGALTIGTLDGANVEIREKVGAENFFLFGLAAGEVNDRRRNVLHARQAIEASQSLKDVLMMIAEGRFSPSAPGRYHGLVDRMWQHDHFLVASDYAAYEAAQDQVDAVWSNPDTWDRMAILNVARMGFFSSDRAIRGYMKEIWQVESALEGE
ncbi:glycogen/starch/alpha-glucan phosphorylase [Frigidibacter sp. RF13]|uniref:glycogen/starch/alpha-glucan phosphorylase n=1 Tax=Frigidibacter sp. RF13 TaxID=2997340 RepID=UPI00226E7242|nr:glycogen/starch/alpha-glucan phosphorylase [Frigidibacter sp. RF13]MCY1125630.1 glycogen/starch/alpha-glucan phosphorylase [Frigidibacter sp. RF13]